MWAGNSEWQPCFNAFFEKIRYVLIAIEADGKHVHDLRICSMCAISTIKLELNYTK